MRPEPGKRICDPAAGTGGFLLASHDYIIEHNQLDPDQKRFLKHDALHGWEIVDNTAPES
jgi:type I restriction enzyme M protein